MIHPDGCQCDLYGCQLRRKGVNFSETATGINWSRRPFRPPVNCSWEAGVAGESRPDGSRMPYLDEKGQKIRLKEYGEKRHELTEIRRRQVEGPAPQE
jgi:hypothetical protein